MPDTESEDNPEARGPAPNKGAAVSAGVVLGFDFGLKQIGVAVAATLAGAARPLTILNANDGVPRWEQLEQLMQEWQPVSAIVGLPLNMDGSESEMSARARKFANRLHGRFGISVEMQDERLTSREAKTAVDETFAKSQRKTNNIKPGARVAKNQVDAIAAALILDSWLTSNRPVS